MRGEFITKKVTAFLSKHGIQNQKNNPNKRKPAWVREAIQGAERYGAPKENHIERKRTRSCSR